MSEWIGVDLDSTIAYWTGWVEGIGSPIEPMIRRIKEWRKKGIEVRILTARVAKCPTMFPEDNFSDERIETQRKMVEEWCLDNIGEVLPVTATKDYEMKLLYDDRAIRVSRNSGFICEGCQRSM